MTQQQLEQRIKELAPKIFEARPDKDYSEFEINGYKVVVNIDKLHNGSYITAFFEYDNVICKIVF